MKLRALTQTAIEDATARYTAGGSRQAWEADMKSAIGRGHIAAFLAGTSERLNVPLDSPLLSRARLSKAERVDITAAVKNQLAYFKDFAAAAGDMSPEAIAARANLYAGATQGSYWKSVIDVEIPCVPGECPACLSNCRCRLETKDDGIHWICLDDPASCSQCVERGNTWMPYKG